MQNHPTAPARNGKRFQAAELNDPSLEPLDDLVARRHQTDPERPEASRILINAMLKVLGATGTTWRGTRYRGNVLEVTPATESAASHTSSAPSVKPAPTEEIVADG